MSLYSTPVPNRHFRSGWRQRHWRQVCLLVGFVCLLGCAPAFNREPTANLNTYGQWRNVDFRHHALHFVEAGVPGKPLVIFIHGTPGTWQAFQTYLQDERLSTRLHLIALDRPGFGRSEQLGALPRFADQAAAVAALFNLNGSQQKILVVGHSLGGSISYRVAADYAGQVGAVLAISSALDPDLSTPRWYNYFAKLPPIRWIIPTDLAMSNKEMMPLADELSGLRDKLGGLNMPITIIQGNEDGLVHIDNVAYAEKMLPPDQIKVMRYPHRGHFIVWQEHDQVVAEILRLTTKLEPSGGPVVLQNNK